MKIDQKLSMPPGECFSPQFPGRSPSPQSSTFNHMPAERFSLEKKIIHVSIVVALLTLTLIVFLLVLRTSRLAEEVRQRRIVTMESLHPVKVSSSTELLASLQSRELWDIEEDETIAPVIYSNFPQDIRKLDVETKKRAFLHTLLPLALIALNEVEREREALLEILAKLDPEEDNLIFDDEDSSWPETLSETEISLLSHLSAKYRTNSKQTLLNKVNTLPVSLILAQGALESSWGSSRFAVQGNNLFGLWTWGNKGIQPARREEGATHKVAVYPTLLESVRAYLLNLNRLPAYAMLRKLRRKTPDPTALAEGLLYYSERREGYIEDVKQIIRINNLRKFDTIRLADNFRWQMPESLRLVSHDGESYAKM